MSEDDRARIEGKWEAEWETNWKKEWKKYQQTNWERIYQRGEWAEDWQDYWKQFWDKKWSEGEWNKDWKDYWTQFWDKKWHAQGMQKIQPSMAKLMNKLWKLQGKTSKLIILLANKTDEPQFKEEIEELENNIAQLQSTIDKKYDEVK